MLTQFIYRSRSTVHMTELQVRSLASACEESNRRNDISGIVFFDGEYFLQVLEGELAVLEELISRIKPDTQHENFVTLFKEPIDVRRFSPSGLRWIDTRYSDVPTEVMANPLQLFGSERIGGILNAFNQGLWSDPTVPVRVAKATPGTAARTLSPTDLADMSHHGACFAFQPIIDIQTQTVTSFEALIRGRDGRSPQDLLGSLRGKDLHLFDLQSKNWALQTARKLGIGCTLSLNLLPQSLCVPSGVDLLLGYIASAGFEPRQILLEITEDELVEDSFQFMSAIDQMRAAGIRLAIDDFGAGHAGLSLLAEFQPDKLKIDRVIVSRIHESGPRQAIVWSVLDFCKRLGITVVAEGVETLDELRWLHAAGVSRIQGFLVARPLTQGLPAIDWPPL